MKRRLKWLVLALALPILLALTISSCMDFRMKPQEASAYFAQRGVTATHHRYTVDGRPMHYVATGPTDKPVVVFVHGSPGSWDAFIHFLSHPELRDKARLVSVDRPGFGDSGFGRHEPSLKAQAASLLPMVRAEGHGQPVLLVGHSLGGPVVARFAMDYPELTQGLVLVAPSIDPALERTKWYQIPADWRLLSWLVPTTLRVTNREILPLKRELELMTPLWSSIQAPVTVIQGDKDRLVPRENADFAARMLAGKPLEMVRIAEMDHFVPWTHPQLITAAVQAHLPEAKTSDAAGLVE